MLCSPASQILPALFPLPSFQGQAQKAALDPPSVLSLTPRALRLLVHRDTWPRLPSVEGLVQLWNVMVPADEEKTQCLHFTGRKQGPERPSNFLKGTPQGSGPDTGNHESQVSAVLDFMRLRYWRRGGTGCPAVEASLPPGAIHFQGPF